MLVNEQEITSAYEIQSYSKLSFTLKPLWSLLNHFLDLSADGRIPEIWQNHRK